MREEEVLRRLQEVFDEIFLQPVSVTPTLTAADVPEWDSLLHISLLIAVEKRFGVRFRTGEVEAIPNVGAFAAAISRRMG